MEIISGIYKIINQINGKIYIGSSKDINYRCNRHFSDLRNNCHRNRYLQRSWNKYGENNFRLEIIEIIDKNTTTSEFKYNLLTREQYYLDTILFAQEWITRTNNTFRKLGYNLNPVAGSPLGFKHSQHTKDLMSAQRIGVKKSKQHAINIGLGHKDKIVSDKTREKLRLIQTGKVATIEAKENMRQAQLGRKHDEETKNKIGTKHKNKIVSEETRQNISESWKLREIIKCTHCGKISNNLGNMNRWHFDNCKNKKTE